MFPRTERFITVCITKGTISTNPQKNQQETVQRYINWTKTWMTISKHELCLFYFVVSKLWRKEFVNNNHFKIVLYRHKNNCWGASECGRLYKWIFIFEGSTRHSIRKLSSWENCDEENISGNINSGGDDNLDNNPLHRNISSFTFSFIKPFHDGKDCWSWIHADDNKRDGCALLICSVVKVPISGPKCEKVPFSNTRNLLLLL